MREVLHNIPTEFGVRMKLFRLIVICSNETYSKARISIYLSDTFNIRNGLKQGDAFITIHFQLCFRICHYEGPGNPDGTDTSVAGLCHQKPLGTPRRRWENNIKMHFTDIEWDDKDCTDLAEDSDQ